MEDVGKEPEQASWERVMTGACVVGEYGKHGRTYPVATMTTIIITFCIRLLGLP